MISSLAFHSRISFARGTSSSGDSDAERQTMLDIKCLQILRAVIYNKIILVDEEDKERNPKQYREYVVLRTYLIVGTWIWRSLPGSVKGKKSKPNEKEKIS